ncbi:hypothetical protein E2651_29395 [Streptomyces sp. MZ04]|nr:hypothetical protein E2651_29395 [Streptomyces sp. MZ04]
MAGLWRQIPLDRTVRWLAVLVRTALGQVSHVIGPDKAEVALAERLSRRIAAQDTPVRNVVGWLVRRGLPQRPGCWSQQCDDGLRMDTRESCDSCATLRGDRQSRYRQLMRDAAGGQWARLPQQQRSEIEHQVNEEYRQIAKADSARREHQRREKADRDTAVAHRRLELQEKQAAAQARPCGMCGRPDTAGECSACRSQQLAANSVRAAVDLVVALRADLTDMSAVEELTRTVETDTWKVVRQHQVPVGDGAADVLRHFADQVLAERRARALARLAQSAPAIEEGQLVYKLTLNRPTPRRACRKDLLAAAEHEAERARQKVARELLDDFLADLAEARARGCAAEPSAGGAGGGR